MPQVTLQNKLAQSVEVSYRDANNVVVSEKLKPHNGRSAQVDVSDLTEQTRQLVANGYVKMLTA